MKVKLTSFGYKHGVPQADIVISAKKLPNPYHDPRLHKLNGRDAEVQEFVTESHEGNRFVERAYSYICNHENYYDKVEVAIGCVGGKHRSVAVVEELAMWLDGAGHELEWFHRDIDK